MKFKSLGVRLISLILIVSITSCSSGRKSISIIESTDIHGVILPYDFIEKKELSNSMGSSFTFIKKERKEKNVVLLLDNGDNLQGQPEVYYYNFIDTVTPHFMSQVMNYMGYDAATVGNHDIEAGHAVYDRMIKADNFPLLAANAIDVNTVKPYFKPYTIIEKEGIRIAVFGMVTPAIPNFLPPELYSGMEFNDMVETAKKWMPVIKKEKPDIIVGLFHSGWDRNGKYIRNSENGSASVAYNVPGFNIIFTGHDHKIANEKIVNSAGDTVLILNGGSRSEKLAVADIILSGKKHGGNLGIKTHGDIINVADFKPDADFLSRFSSQSNTINEYVNRVIGTSSETITSRDAYFGSSAFIDMIHKMQLEITGADISFAAPLSFDVQINKGAITVGDMFKLYRFENMLYTMSMSGDEIQKYLEYSYAGWLNTMKGPSDLMLRLRTDFNGKPELSNDRAYFKNQSYNFDSAAGIDYTVDVSKPAGSRLRITGLSNGKPFEKNKMYKVAVNSYRGNGGGGLLTEGAGIPKDEIRKRLISSTDRDLRYYILKSIEDKKIIIPEPFNNWKIIPESWVKAAELREYRLLFGEIKN